MNALIMLRRNLPLGDDSEYIRETIKACKKSGVDEIAWITESSGFYKELAPIPEIKKIVERLLYAKEACLSAGILFSINPLTTMGHGDYGGDLASTHPGLEFFVDFNGNKSKSCACPLSPVWLDLMRETFRLYAETMPVRLWIEDDFRLFWHGHASGPGCFCPRHMREFSKIWGTDIGRKELVSLILRPGRPHPAREKWFSFAEAGMISASGMIAQTVRSVSPKTQMGWMSAVPAFMEISGASPANIIRAAAGPDGAAIRMHTTHFVEVSHRDMLLEDLNLKQVITSLPPNTLKCTEVESMPHSSYTKSAARVAAQCEWAHILNVPCQTLNIFDYIFTPLKYEPQYLAEIKRRGPLWDTLSNVFNDHAVPEGVGLLTDYKPALRVRTRDGADFKELMARADGWADPLRAFGVPVVFSMGQRVTALTGQAPRFLGRAGLKNIFSRGVLLDLSALETVSSMGFADLTGVELSDVVAGRSRQFGSEAFTDPAFGGGPGRHGWLYGEKRIGIPKRKGACAISEILDADKKTLWPSVCVFQNNLGGRVAVFPYDFTGNNSDAHRNGPSAFFYSEYRKQQIQSLIRWLSFGKTSMIADAKGWTLPHRAVAKDYLAVAVMNLNMDTWKNFGIECFSEKEALSVSVIDSGGCLRELDKKSWSQRDGLVRARIKRTVQPERTVVVIVRTS